MDVLMLGVGFKRLNNVVVQLFENFSMVYYYKLDCIDEDSVGGIFSYIDECIQWVEVQEFKEIFDEEYDDEE